MSKARLVITALFVEGPGPPRSPSRYGVHRAWVYKLRARYEAEGDAAFEPRSRRPKTSPERHHRQTVELVLRLRKELAETGLDAGADTIGWHLRHHHQHRAVAGHDQPHPGPGRRRDPRAVEAAKSSYIRFAAEQPNETWQSDFTHYRLTRPDGSPGSDTEIITWLDDHSRYALPSPPTAGSPGRSCSPRSAKPCPARHPGLDADRQRHGLHHPVRRRPRRPQRPGARATPAQHRPEELPTPTTPPPAARSSDSSRR